MKLRFSTMSIAVMTDRGLYGRRHVFQDGLNILRADNSKGKSTILKSLIYALGLEGMFTSSFDIPLPHVLTEFVDDPGGDAKVIEASVTLEIINQTGETLTVSRPIAGERDRHLISVRTGAALSNPDAAGASEDFFVRTPRSARSERGFHTKLSEFIGWTLPEVSNFDGGKIPLYLETIFPLFNVEQKLGWGRVPARFPTWLGVKDVRRRTVEFLLKLDAYAIAEERLAIQQEMARVRALWTEGRKLAGKRAVADGGILNAMPTEPVSKWPPENPPQIYIITRTGNWQTLAAHTEVLLKRQAELKNEAVPMAGADDEGNRFALATAESAISERETLLRQTLQGLEGDISEADALQDRINSLIEDQRKYKDIRKLREMGADTVAEILHGTCPTCLQDISDSLMDLGRKSATMSVDQNISFYDEQLQISEAVLQNARNSILASEAQVAALRGDLDRLRSEVRGLRETLSSPANSPSIEALTERLRVEQRLESVASLGVFFDDFMGTFANLSDDWNALLERLRNLPRGSLSNDDQKKLEALQESLQGQLVAYGFGSVRAQLVTVSRDDYEPELTNINLSADAAASDVIRLQWAYLLGLAEVSGRFQGNHPKLLIFDEPQQQSVKDADFFRMLKHAAALKDMQIIVGTSHEAEGIAEFAVHTTGVNLWELHKEHLIVRLG